jgi:hypothetical protein
VRAGRFIIDAIACGVRRELMVGCGTRPIVQDCGVDWLPPLAGPRMLAALRGEASARVSLQQDAGQSARRDRQSTRRWIGQRALTCTM